MTQDVEEIATRRNLEEEAKARAKMEPTEEFDEGERLLRVQERQVEILTEAEAMHQSLQNGGAQPEKHIDPEEVINGIKVPKVTPHLPQHIIEYQDVPNPDGARDMLVEHRGKYYRRIQKPNPEYVSPEDRANALVRARKAAPVEEPSVPDQIIDEKPEMETPFSHGIRIQQLLGSNYTVKDLKLSGSQLIITVE